MMLMITPRTPTGCEGRSTPHRGEHNMERPIRRWNEWMDCPLPLKGLCSCRFAEKGKGAHTWYYVGTSFPAPWNEPGWDEGNCGKLAMRPSVAHTPVGVKQGLCGIIRYSSHALKERLGSRLPKHTSGPEDDYVRQLPRHVAAPLVHGGVTPTAGGASADTRLADTVIDAPKADS